MILLRNIGRLFTAGPAGVVCDAAVVIEGATIAFAGAESELGAELLARCEERLDLGGALVTPGLIDAHTHPVYYGERLEEIGRRSAGASYREIAASGGGIASSVATTRAATAAQLEEAVIGRLGSWLVSGTTTVEAKTGYHLDRKGELGDLEMLARLAAHSGQPGEPGRALPEIEITFLGAHAVAPEHRGDQGAQVAWVIDSMPAALAAGARHADVFCDEGYFAVSEARKILEAGRRAGLLARIHADELVRTGGARLAAEMEVVSADHLLRIERSDAEALARAGVVATLAPLTGLAMGVNPPARMLRAAGATIAVASDHNPGSSGSTSMSLVVGLASLTLGLSVGEALTAATAGGAAALGLTDRGQVTEGRRADLVAWPTDHEAGFSFRLGLLPSRVFLAGREVLRRT
jgi:imidazolonepropionase